MDSLEELVLDNNPMLDPPATVSISATRIIRTVHLELSFLTSVFV